VRCYTFHKLFQVYKTQREIPCNGLGFPGRGWCSEVSIHYFIPSLLLGQVSLVFHQYLVDLEVPIKKIKILTLILFAY